MEGTERFPGMNEGMKSLETDIDALEHINQALSGDDTLRVPALVERLHNMHVTAERLAIDAAVHAFQHGHLTQRGAADRLRIHPYTFKRLVDERTEADGQEV